MDAQCVVRTGIYAKRFTNSSSINHFGWFEFGGFFSSVWLIVVVGVVAGVVVVVVGTEGQI